MRTYDLTPFYRSTVGFDRLFSLLDQANVDGSNGYPPYNIERTGENAYRISVAVSGFAQAGDVVFNYALCIFGTLVVIRASGPFFTCFTVIRHPREERAPPRFVPNALEPCS